MQQRRIAPSAKGAGLGAGIGWHTLRHSFQSWLGMSGTPLEVQKELMRHASIKTTMDVCGTALEQQKRAAHASVVELLRPITWDTVVSSDTHPICGA